MLRFGILLGLSMVPGLAWAGTDDPVTLARAIDEEIGKRLAEEKVPVSPRSDDAEFVRRVYLDLTGVIPTAAKAVEFIDRKDPAKRAQLIDELLASPAFGRHMADIWDKVLFQRVTDNRAIKIDPLTDWLQERFNAGMGWDRMVRELITATGTQEENGAATYFLAALTADKMVDSVSRAFMGIKIECTQCHNHPFTGWKQADYWGMAAFFMKVRIQGNPRNANRGGTPGVVESDRGRQRNLPDSAKVLPPKFFQGQQPATSAAEPLRPVLAQWLTSPANPFFSRAFANRVWGQLFGGGIINPIDDMHEERIASHPALLALLAKRFAAGGFDVKSLFRGICRSDAYQRTSRPAAGNESDHLLFSHMNIKVLTPEQLFDSLVAVLGEPGGRGAARRPAQNAGRGPATPRDQFIAFFDPGEGSRATDYQDGIPQALRLMNGPFLARNSLTVAREITRGLPQPQAMSRLYLTVLSRRPTAEESARLTAYAARAESRESAYGDVLWALLNSSEFTLNH
jgi:hypothetical protein